VAFPAIRLKQTPNETTYKLCEEAGTDLGQLLTRERNIKQIKSLDTNLELALGRVSGGCTLSPPKGDVTSAMLASCVLPVSNHWD